MNFSEFSSSCSIKPYFPSSPPPPSFLYYIFLRIFVSLSFLAFLFRREGELKEICPRMEFRISSTSSNFLLSPFFLLLPRLLLLSFFLSIITTTTTSFSSASPLPRLLHFPSSPHTFLFLLPHQLPRISSIVSGEFPWAKSHCSQQSLSLLLLSPSLLTIESLLDFLSI